MMREILFRGKRTDNDEWIEGYYVDVCTGEGYILYPNSYWDDLRYSIGNVLFEVFKDTVGQFTGLTDMNGNKIFEGDIVVYNDTPYNAYGHRVTGVIVWHKWMWKFRYKEYESTYHYSCGSEDFFGAKSEVIGNIHDNPELLEVAP